MKIAVDASCWSNQRGYGRYIRGLVPALIAADQHNAYVLVTDRQTSAEIPADLAPLVIAETREAPTAAARAGSNRSPADVWKLSATASAAKADVIFFPSVYTYFPVRTGPKVIVTIHDVIAEDFPDLVFPSRRERFLWNAKVALARWQSDHIVTVSEHARRAIARKFGVDPKKITVVSEAADPAFRPLGPSEINAAAFPAMGIAERDRILLYLGGLNPHKNLPGLVQAVAASREGNPSLHDLKLVICGDIETEHFTPGLARLRETIRTCGLQQEVVFTGFLDDENVCQLMNRATALALPSFAEGFGLPAVEAAACGTPVIATINSPLPELLEGGGIFIDPTDVASMTAAITRIFSDGHARQSLARAARERAARLTWPRAAESMVEVLRKLEAGRS